MFGDWGGERTRLEQMGITFYGKYRDDFQGNVTGTDKNGNERDHSVNLETFYLNLDVDLMKLANIAGEFFFRAVWREPFRQIPQRAYSHQQYRGNQ